MCNLKKKKIQAYSILFLGEIELSHFFANLCSGLKMRTPEVLLPVWCSLVRDKGVVLLIFTATIISEYSSAGRELLILTTLHGRLLGTPFCGERSEAQRGQEPV